MQGLLRGLLPLGVLVVGALAGAVAIAAGAAKPSYNAARWDARHFSPLIEKTPDSECLQCHAETLAPSVRAKSPAGLAADKSLAWYQTLETYAGAQDTLHRRHLESDFAKQVMALRCNTCHQGHDPRDEAPGTSATAQSAGYTLRKQVDPKTCLLCHGQFNYEVMGLPGPWAQHGETFGNNCLTCHEGLRTQRHQVNFLKPAAIEAAGKESADACYGCHGGRAWYRIPYPYPRHAWEGMDKEVPDWAKQRPTESEPRFRLPSPLAAAQAAAQSVAQTAAPAIAPAEPIPAAAPQVAKPAAKASRKVGTKPAATPPTVRNMK